MLERDRIGARSGANETCTPETMISVITPTFSDIRASPNVCAMDGFAPFATFEDTDFVERLHRFGHAEAPARLSM